MTSSLVYYYHYNIISITVNLILNSNLYIMYRDKYGVSGRHWKSQ